MEHIVANEYCPAKAAIEAECLAFADLGYRLLTIVLGDHATKLNQLAHLLVWRGPDANDLAVWLLANDANPEVKRLAVCHLAEKGTPDCYKGVLEASRDPDPRVREAAATALARLPGPKTLQRLAAILEDDVAGEVRRAARHALHELVSVTAEKRRDLVGRRVLIMDEEQPVVSPLVDALEQRGIEVKATTNADELRRILQEWVPHAVVSELLLDAPANLPVDWNAVRGMSLARLARESLGPNVPIVATSLVDPEEITPQLASIQAVYVRKPTTLDAFLRAIESLLQQAPPAAAADGQLPRHELREEPISPTHEAQKL